MTYITSIYCKVFVYDSAFVYYVSFCLLFRRIRCHLVVKGVQSLQPHPRPRLWRPLLPTSPSSVTQTTKTASTTITRLATLTRYLTFSLLQRRLTTLRRQQRDSQQFLSLGCTESQDSIRVTQQVFPTSWMPALEAASASFEANAKDQMCHFHPILSTIGNRCI